MPYIFRSSSEIRQETVKKQSSTNNSCNQQYVDVTEWPKTPFFCDLTWAPHNYHNIRRPSCLLMKEFLFLFGLIGEIFSFPSQRITTTMSSISPHDTICQFRCLHEIDITAIFRTSIRFKHDSNSWIPAVCLLQENFLKILWKFWSQRFIYYSKLLLKYFLLAIPYKYRCR